MTGTRRPSIPSVTVHDHGTMVDIPLTPALPPQSIYPGTSANLPSSPDPRLSPILNRSPNPLPTPKSPQPEFAELLTPAKLRRKRRHIPPVSLPPSVAGPSRAGFQTDSGDVYRGAIVDPTLKAEIKLETDDEAITFDGSSSSSGSTWSIVSDLERGRRRTVAAIERFGERIGVRRGSDSSESVASSRLDQARELRHQSSRRRLSVSRRITRTLTRRSSVDSAKSDAPRREYKPRKREFELLLPEGGGSGDRIVSTPSLPVVLDLIRPLRVKAGIAMDSPTTTPAPSRGGSGRGYQRRPIPKRSQTSFAHPPLPRPIPSGITSPLVRSPLASPGNGPQPKSVSDLLHLPSPASAPNLTKLVSAFPSNPLPDPLRRKPGGAWWLDVSCPTWEDLRDIGELLSLHPLTLEDVLQQDPREKLDMFDKLGYYFVVIRALDETYFKYTPGTGSVSSIGKTSPAMSAGSDNTMKEKGADEKGSPELFSTDEKHKEGRRRGWGMGRAVGKLAGRQGEKVEIVEDNPGREGLEGVGVGGVNIYLAVFADGVVSFHYEDISKHTLRVRDRILSLAGGTEHIHTADWVAHGLIDSVVDAFFPLIRYVDGEVDDIDSLTIDPSVDPRAPSDPVSVSRHQEGDQTYPPIQRGSEGPTSESSLADVKRIPPHKLVRSRLRLRLPSIHFPLSRASPSSPTLPILIKQALSYLIYLRLFFLPISSAVRHRHKPPEPIFDRTTMLRRITDLRRLVTGLTRLLGLKHQVIGRMRKRAAIGTGRGKGEGEGSAVAAYIGDVEDHILLLQTSLLHYEYILSHCQPAYLSQLSVSFHITRGGIATHILALSTVTITILPMQFVLGIFSENVLTPRDGDRDHLDQDGNPAGFNYFGIVISLVFCIVCGMVTLIRWWRWSARRKFAERRGVEVPTVWEGYWGWK